MEINYGRKVLTIVTLMSQYRKSKRYLETSRIFSDIVISLWDDIKNSRTFWSLFDERKSWSKKNLTVYFYNYRILIFHSKGFNTKYIEEKTMLKLIMKLICFRSSDKFHFFLITPWNLNWHQRIYLSYFLRHSYY